MQFLYLELVTSSPAIQYYISTFSAQANNILISVYTSSHYIPISRNGQILHFKDLIPVYDPGTNKIPFLVHMSIHACTHE